ncbi:unnamed protein product [Amoebophrya sp. A25]|nr:unnamed protein product [Amoebophrya sp. A25]|eukprot:GSA25T00020702001.1
MAPFLRAAQRKIGERHLHWCSGTSWHIDDDEVLQGKAYNGALARAIDRSADATRWKVRGRYGKDHLVVGSEISLKPENIIVVGARLKAAYESTKQDPCAGIENFPRLSKSQAEKLSKQMRNALDHMNQSASGQEGKESQSLNLQKDMINGKWN